MDPMDPPLDPPLLMVGDTHVPSLIVIGTAINQLKTKVSLKTIVA